jgi:drug/metabolite transporter (DMT)-like permease
MKTQAWVSFWLLGLIWGSSFLLIRIGVAELKTAEIVFIRTAIAAIGLGLIIFVRRVRIPMTRRTLGMLGIVGLGNVVAPFMLITWGEQTVPSGMAAVLQSTAALFSLVIAHFAFADERMTVQKVAGLILGFIGVIVLFSGELNNGSDAASLLGHLAIVLASLCYATFTAMSRKVIQGEVEPIAVAFVTMVVASMSTAPFAFFSEAGFTPLASLSPGVLIALLILGLLNTFVAFLLYYFVVRELGAARATMVTYIVPPVGVVLGALILRETIDLTLLTGAALIFAGIGIVNVRLMRRVQQPRPTEQPTHGVG